MRSLIAGLVFGLAYLCAGLAFGGWLLQRTAFEPERTRELAPIVLDNAAIRGEVVDAIADQAAPAMSMTTTEARAWVASIAGTTAGRELLGDVLHDAHSTLIGERDPPVQITGPQLVEVTRYEAAGAITVQLPDVKTVGVLDSTRQVLDWLVPAAAVGALVFLLISVAVHPARAAVLRGLGFGLLLLALLGVVFGVLLPRFAIPQLSDSPWAEVPRIISDDALPRLLALEIVLVAVGFGLLIAVGIARRRRRWNHPTTRYRYNEERHWSV
jgi:hypothetical protein